MAADGNDASLQCAEKSMKTAIVNLQTLHSKKVAKKYRFVCEKKWKKSH